jgi:catechol-2,3-dioxygenase
MLGDHPIDVMLLATDLGVAREFYGERIGLEVLIENDAFLTKTVEGIADVGFALASWFIDPDGNSIGMLQLKGEEAD